MMQEAEMSPRPTGVSSYSGRWKGSDMQRILGFGQRGPRCFFAWSKTSKASEIRGHSPLLCLPSRNASSPPHAVPLTQNPSLMGNRQALAPALWHRSSGPGATQSQTCSCVLRVAGPVRNAARARCVRHQTRRTFPGQNLYVALASSAQQGLRVGC